MKAVIQRVKEAEVTINGSQKKRIKEGLVVLIGIGNNDSQKDAVWMGDKVLNLRIFSNEKGKFDKSVIDIKGDILAISQFTLYCNAGKGRRPDFTEASKTEIALPVYQEFVEKLKLSGLNIQTGEFGAKMLVNIQNDGPVTIILDSKSI